MHAEQHIACLTNEAATIRDASICISRLSFVSLQGRHVEESTGPFAESLLFFFNGLHCCGSLDNGIADGGSNTSCTNHKDPLHTIFDRLVLLEKARHKIYRKVFL
jgi:hypothetical protein